jgi:hypothetical protein
MRRRRRCLLDRRGVPLSEVRIDPRVRQLDWIGLTDVSPAVAATLIASEDKRFFEHGGVDWSGLAGAAWDSVWRTLDGRRARGGSTLTMQLAGMLDPALALSGNSRTFTQKWDQAQAALALERTWTKPQILERISISRRTVASSGARCRGAGPVRQGAGRARCARGGDSGRAAARAQRAGCAGCAARMQRHRAFRTRGSLRGSAGDHDGGAGRCLPHACALEPRAASCRKAAQIRG